MKLNYSVTFNANRERVLELFSDPAFFEQHQAKMNSADFELLEHQDDGNSSRIKFRYQADSDVPAFAKKVLGETAEVVQEETWDRSTGTGVVTVDVATMPGTMRCEARLEDSGDNQCVKSYDWEIKVKIPLIGGKIEKVVAEDIKKKSGPDQDAVNALLG